MFSNLFGGKAWYESLTAWGLVLVGAAGGAEEAGLVAPGLTQQVAEFTQALGGLLVVLGIRRAATAPK